MNEIRYRLAKPSDAKEIAIVHWHVRDRYAKGFFLSMGKEFLKTYYKVILDDPWEVVVCAVKEDDKIVGFSSTSMNAKERYKNIRKHRIILGLAALKAVVIHPSLMKGLWQRYRSLEENSHSAKFVNQEGARGGYWCWLKGDDSLKSIELSNIHNDVLYDLGLREKYFEVDKSNKAVYKFHLMVNKAEPIEEITLPDGRVRVLMRKKLE